MSIQVKKIFARFFSKILTDLKTNFIQWGFLRPSFPEITSLYFNPLERLFSWKL